MAIGEAEVLPTQVAGRPVRLAVLGIGAGLPAVAAVVIGERGAGLTLRAVHPVPAAARVVGDAAEAAGVGIGQVGGVFEDARLGHPAIGAHQPLRRVVDSAGLEVVVAVGEPNRHLKGPGAQTGTAPHAVHDGVGDGPAPSARVWGGARPEPGAVGLALLQAQEPVIGPLAVQVRVHDLKHQPAGRARAAPHLAVLDVLVQDHRDLQVRVRLRDAVGAATPAAAASASLIRPSAIEVVNDLGPVL